MQFDPHCFFHSQIFTTDELSNYIFSARNCSIESWKKHPKCQIIRIYVNKQPSALSKQLIPTKNIALIFHVIKSFGCFLQGSIIAIFRTKNRSFFFDESLIVGDCDFGSGFLSQFSAISCPTLMIRSSIGKQKIRHCRVKQRESWLLNFVCFLFILFYFFCFFHQNIHFSNVLRRSIWNGIHLI